MHLNHLDLQAHDVQALAAFFVDHFELKRVSNATSPAIAILEDGHLTLVIQRRTDDAPYPAGFHIGFYVADVAAVEAQHARLTAAGVTAGPIQTNARGTMFYVHAPGGILIEVNARI